MAQRVETFPDLPTQSRYPWDEWLDGSVWELVHGEDFDAQPSTFRSVAVAQGKKRRGRVRTRLVRGEHPDQPDRMYVQFAQDAH